MRTHIPILYTHTHTSHVHTPQLVAGDPISRQIWIYFAAPPLGGALAGCVYRLTNANEF